MASTRKPARSDPVAALRQAVAADLGQRLLFMPARTVAVACSGGLDSTVLLDALAHAAMAQHVKLIVLHVHHGLQADAARWADSVAAEAARRGLPFECLSVAVRRAPRTSVEAEARLARYSALDAACVRWGADALALAHHADDQAETLLLQLARGAGLAGLAGMAPWQEAERSIARWRPLLGRTRADVAAYAQALGLAWHDDPSNAQLRWRRNALRHTVMPAFEAAAGPLAQALGRSARHLQAALDIVRSCAHADLAAARCQGGVAVDILAALPAARRAEALRAWIADLGVCMPSERRLDELWRQAACAKPDRQVRVAHAGGAFRVYRRRVHWIAPEREAAVPVASAATDAIDAAPTLHWTGQTRWPLPRWGGALHFTQAQTGISALWLQSVVLVARPRRGGERFRAHPAQPSRTLKAWYQRLGVPVWLRQTAPLVWAHDTLLYVPGVGMAAEVQGAEVQGAEIVPHASTQAGAAGGPAIAQAGETRRIQLRWVPDVHPDKPV